MSKTNCVNKAESFDFIAREIFYPLYEVIAKHAIERTTVSEGRCLDIGCGGGLFGINVLKISNLRLTFCDINEDAIEICKKRLEDLSYTGETMVSTVHKINYQDNSFDLIISRSSLAFWGDEEEMKIAFKEIYRVLKPNGKTYIGRGFGNKQIYDDVVEKMKTHNPDWPECTFGNGFGPDDYKRMLNELDINFEIYDDESGYWIIMKK